MPYWPRMNPAGQRPGRHTGLACHAQAAKRAALCLKCQLLQQAARWVAAAAQQGGCAARCVSNPGGWVSFSRCLTMHHQHEGALVPADGRHKLLQGGHKGVSGVVKARGGLQARRGGRRRQRSAAGAQLACCSCLAGRRPTTQHSSPGGWQAALLSVGLHSTDRCAFSALPAGKGPLRARMGPVM